MPRVLKNLDITLGLAVIPVQFFTATKLAGRRLPLASRAMRFPDSNAARMSYPIHGIVPREETVRGYETSKDEYVRLEPEELKALEHASSSALVIDSFVSEGAIDSVYFEDTYYLGAGKNGERGYRVLVGALEKTHRIAVGTFTWRGKTTPIAIRRHQDGLLLQRLYFADEVQRGRDRPRCCAAPKIRDQERTLAERLNQRTLRHRVSAGELRGRVPEVPREGDRAKVTGEEIQRIEVGTPPPTTDLVATLKASLGRKELAKAPATKAKEEPAPAKRPVGRRRAS
jgi:DNA end-binding protein Ku